MANGAHRVLDAGCLGKTADLVDCRACKTPSFAIRCICLAAPVATSLIPRRCRSTAWIVLMISNAYAIRGESKKKSSMRTRLLLNQSVTTYRTGAPRAPARPTVPGTLQSAGDCAVRDAMKGAHITLRNGHTAFLVTTAASASKSSSRPRRLREPRAHDANLLYRFRDASAADGAICNGVWRRPRSDGWVDKKHPDDSAPASTQPLRRVSAAHPTACPLVRGPRHVICTTTGSGGRRRPSYRRIAD